MPTQNVTLTEELAAFVEVRVKTGRYADASEVIRAALRNLEREEREYEAKMVALENALDEGEQSGVFPGDAFASVREELGLPLRR